MVSGFSTFERQVLFVNLFLGLLIEWMAFAVLEEMSGIDFYWYTDTAWSIGLVKRLSLFSVERVVVLSDACFFVIVEMSPKV